MGPVRDIELYKKLKLRESEYFYIHEPVSKPLMYQAMTQADVVVNTSISEGMSGALLEAMSCETLIFARDIPANRELLSCSQKSMSEPHCGVLFRTPKILFLP